MGEQDSGIDPDRLARAALEIGAERACGGDEVGTCEARARREVKRRRRAAVDSAAHLIPVVTATCPRRLNQPVIHDAKAALWGLEIMAAQK